MRQRKRILNPDVFTDPELAEILTPAERLFYIGLWTIADREGRLEDKPKEIKLYTLPFDDIDVSGILDKCHNCEGLLERYKVNGKCYIQINPDAWAKHQSIHKKERASTIPFPESPGNSGELPVITGLPTSSSSSSSSSTSSSTSTASSSLKEPPFSNQDVDNSETPESVRRQIAESRASVKPPKLNPLQQSFEDWRSTDTMWLEQYKTSEGLKTQVKTQVEGVYNIVNFVDSFIGDLRHDANNRPDKFQDVPDEQGWRNLLKGYVRIGIKDGKLGNFGMRNPMTADQERKHEAKKRRTV